MLTFEKLESRNLMTFIADINPNIDVNQDNNFTPADALIIINEINSGNSSSFNTDINNDGTVAPLDALQVINVLNRIPDTIFRVNIRDSDTIGFNNQQVLAAIDIAFEEYETIANIGFIYTNIAPHVNITTSEIYLGNGVHARGQFTYPNLIELHNGIIAPFHHSGRNGPIDKQLLFQVYGNEAHIQQIIGHEFGHYLGFGHSNNTNCRMNINAPPGFCNTEVQILQSRFGKSKG